MEQHNKIIKDILKKAQDNVKKGFGPFYAAIYDENGEIVAESSNSVVNENCSNYHAEMNVIYLAEQKLGTYDLSKYNLSIYITAEPCIMCVGGIMWSGIKKVFFSVPTSDVEKITGFDEGFKPNWIEEFSKRGIEVIGGIEIEAGKKVLVDYVNSGYKIYKPLREN